MTNVPFINKITNELSKRKLKSDVVANAILDIAVGNDRLDNLLTLQSSASEIDNNIGLNLDFNTFEDNQEIPMLLWGGLIGATALPRVLNGTMTFAPTGAGAGYSQYLHNAPVKRLYAKFRFGEYTTNTGSIDLITWASDFEQSYPIIPDSPCHLAVSPTSWNYSVCSGGTLTTVASGFFYVPLDISKDYECEVVIDHDKQVATLCLPDGSVRYISHANIAFKTNYSVFEIYRNKSTDTIGAFTSIKSSVFGDDRLLDLYRSTLKQDKIQALTYAPTTAEYQTVPTSATLINAALVLPIIVPQSGSILVELTANVLHAAASNLLWQLADSLAGSLRTISVSSTVYTGNIHASVVISGLTPGRTMNLQWKHFTTVASSATIQMHHASGFLTTMKATPL